LTLTLAGVAGGTTLRIMKIMRLLRALRPLRVINKAPRLKRVVVCMIDSCASIGNTLIIIALVFLIFGILAIQLFGGKMYSCDPAEMTIGNTTVEPATKQECLDNGGEWVNATFNYDNLGQAVLSLFYVVSFDGWVDMMYTGVDAKAVDTIMEEDYNETACIFFVIFLIIGNFFVLNLFVGVIVDSFNNSAAGIMALDNSKSDKELANEHRIELEKQEKNQIESLFYLEYPEGGINRKCYDLVTSPQFDVVISSVIVVNVGCMAIEHYDQPDWLTDTFTAFNYVFTLVFLGEAIVKIVAFGLQRYLCSGVEAVASGWNKFDFFLVFASFAGLYFDNAGGDVGVDPTMLRVLRVFRIARILRLLKSAKGLKALLNTVAQSLAQVASIGMLLVLAFFIYACAAVQVFGKMSCNDESPCDGLGEHANFESWPYAMLTLFRVCTGDAGAAILADCLREAPVCDDSSTCEINCCAQAPRPIVPMFFMSFTVLAQFIMLNVVVAVLMGQLEEENENQEAAILAAAAAEVSAVNRQAKADAIEAADAEEAAVDSKLDGGLDAPPTMGSSPEDPALNAAQGVIVPAQKDPNANRPREPTQFAV